MDTNLRNHFHWFELMNKKVVEMNLSLELWLVTGLGFYYWYEGSQLDSQQGRWLERKPKLQTEPGTLNSSVERHYTKNHWWSFMEPSRSRSLLNTSYRKAQPLPSSVTSPDYYGDSRDRAMTWWKTSESWNLSHSVWLWLCVGPGRARLQNVHQC